MMVQQSVDSSGMERFPAAGARTVGIVLYGSDRSLGGIGRYTVELINAFHQLGINPMVLEAGCSQASRDICLPAARRLPALLTLGQVQIGWIARHYRLQIIHDPTGSTPLLLTATRRVVTIHDVIPHIYPQSSTRLDWLIYHLWLPIAVRRLHAVITVSEQSRRDILRFLPIQAEKVMVIPEAASAHYRPLQPQEAQPVLTRHGIEHPYILYVGSLEPRKNLPRLLQAYARLRSWGAGHKLVIVGARGSKLTPILEAVQRLNLEAHVHFTGYVAEEDLPALYNGARCFAFPSLYEGFGLPVLEAMACGTPVVTSNVSSLPEVAGDAALLVDPHDVEQIAHALWLVLSQPALAARMRELGLDRAAQFSWERTARQTAAVYKKIIQNT